MTTKMAGGKNKLSSVIWETSGTSETPVTPVTVFKRIIEYANYTYARKELKGCSTEVKQRVRKSIGDITKKELEKLNRWLNLKSSNPENKVFVYALLFRLSELKDILNQNNSNEKKTIVNKTKHENNILMFLVKYVNIEDDKIIQLLEILFDAGIDINKLDMEGKHILDHLVELYPHKIDYTNMSFAIIVKKVVEMIYNQGVSDEINKKTIKLIKKKMDISIKRFIPETDISKIFRLVVTNTLNWEDAEILEKHANNQDGEHTFLQLACMISDKHEKSVKILLEKKANPNSGTSATPQTPLQIAAERNHKCIFDELLKYPKIKINQELYEEYIKYTDAPYAPIILNTFLCSDNLPTTLKSKEGNTPLHIAITSNLNSAISKLLKRGASLYSRNKLGQCPLDLIDPKILEGHFRQSVGNPRSKTVFELDFSCLVNKDSGDECEGIYMISSNPKLEYLVQNSLVYLFISLKWYKAEKYFYTILALQAAIFLLMAIFVYCLAMGVIKVPIILGLGYFLFFLNAAKLLTIFYWYHKKCPQRTSSISAWTINYFSSNLQALPSTIFHILMELSVVVTSFGILISKHTYQKQFSSFIFVEMASCFLLTAGYHPRLSVWSIMLQKVLESFIRSFFFFSLIIIGFAAGFNILFLDDDKEPMFGFFGSSIIKTYIMSLGEFDVNDIQFEKSGPAGYGLLFLFAMCFCLVVVNFWTGVAITDIEKIRNDAELGASKNCIVFQRICNFIFPLNLFIKDSIQYTLNFDNKNLWKNGSNESLRVHDMAVSKIRELCKAVTEKQESPRKYIPYQNCFRIKK